MADGKWVVDKNTVYWTHHHYAGTISSYIYYCILQGKREILFPKTW